MNTASRFVSALPFYPVLRLASLGVATFIFTLFSLELTQTGTLLAPLWFPTSVIMVALYRHPFKMWPFVAMVCCCGNIAASLVLFPLHELNPVYTFINIVEAVVGAGLLRQLLPADNPLQNLRDWIRLAIGSALIPPLIGGLMVYLWVPGTNPLQSFIIWSLSEAIGALALVPLGLIIKPRVLLRLSNSRLLLETLLTLGVTLGLSALAMLYMPWPYTCIIVLLMWSAIRLPRMEAFLIFLCTVMLVALIMANNAPAHHASTIATAANASWLPFVLILLPANIMTMVMYAFRAGSKHIIESEERFRNAMEYSAIGMALVSTEGQWLQVNKSLCQFLGYNADELCAMTFQQLTLPEDLDADLRQRSSLINGEINAYSMEKRYYTRQGEVVWALLAVSLVRNPDSSPLYFIAQIEDINELKKTEQINQRLMERITLANEAGGVGIWEWDLRTNKISWDKRMFELYNVPADIDPTWQVWESCLLEEDRKDATRKVLSSLNASTPLILEFRVQLKGKIRHIRSLANRVVNKHGEVERLLGINIDMTEVKELNEALFQEKERLHITLDAIGEAVVCIDVDMNITFMNPVAENMSGWTQHEALNKPLMSVLHLSTSETGLMSGPLSSSDLAHSSIDEDLILHSRYGGSFDIQYSITPLSTLNGQNIGSVLVIQDVTQSRKMLRQLSYSASHDVLTHLPNRASFESHLKRYLLSIDNAQTRHSLVFIDLDRFKAVNDNAGHAAGDALLREISVLMLSLLRKGDILARLGGDEFGLLLPNCCKQDAIDIAQRIVKSVGAYHFTWKDSTHHVGVSAGITFIHKENADLTELLAQADMACYASKHTGRGRVSVYSDGLDATPRLQTRFSQKE
ncbi:diguanylate cyclase [Pseudocitrobacter sp. Cyp-38S]|uniref:Diguanylate cyclase n=1 Tax=Pseudocitrobacter cyperus TaxID=3112843 RepID=A0ABV0HL39_9ENTR